jgi:hypothetical protein
MKKIKILLALALFAIVNIAHAQCTCSTCSGKRKVAVEKPIIVPLAHRVIIDEIPTKTVIETCPTCQGTGNYCPPPPPCTRTCPACNGNKKESYNYLHGGGQYIGNCQTCSGSGKVPC